MGTLGCLRASHTEGRAGVGRGDREGEASLWPTSSGTESHRSGSPDIQRVVALCVPLIGFSMASSSAIRDTNSLSASPFSSLSAGEWCRRAGEAQDREPGTVRRPHGAGRVRGWEGDRAGRGPGRGVVFGGGGAWERGAQPGAGRG